MTVYPSMMFLAHDDTAVISTVQAASDPRGKARGTRKRGSREMLLAAMTPQRRDDARADAWHVESRAEQPEKPGCRCVGPDGRQAAGRRELRATFP